MSTNQSTFELPAPEGFNPEEGKCSLSSKTLASEDNEFWFIRAPKDFPCDQIHDLQLTIDPSKIPACQFTLDNKNYEITIETNQEISQIFNGIPKKDGTLTFGKPFTKNLFIREVYSTIPPYAEKRPDDWEIPPVPEPKNLKVQNVPSGYVDCELNLDESKMKAAESTKKKTDTPKTKKSKSEDKKVTPKKAKKDKKMKHKSN